ncbi:hypothetical protein E4U54_005056 [Claviceps lovelessii]|nr:hypothetical protein E4U54_005056 [Claviceps lovelessii]
MWAWLTDHDDDTENALVTVTAARGILAESAAALHGCTGQHPEHSVLYQYNFYNTINVFAGVIQTEKSYFRHTTTIRSPGPSKHFMRGFSQRPLAVRVLPVTVQTYRGFAALEELAAAEKSFPDVLADYHAIKTLQPARQKQLRRAPFPALADDALGPGNRYLDCTLDSGSDAATQQCPWTESYDSYRITYKIVHESGFFDGLSKTYGIEIRMGQLIRGHREHLSTTQQMEMIAASCPAEQPGAEKELAKAANARRAIKETDVAELGTI